MLLTETALTKLSAGIKTAPEYGVELFYNEKTSLDHVLRCFKDSHMAIVNLKIHSLEESDEARYVAEISLRSAGKCEELLKKAAQMPGVGSAVGV